MNEHDLFAAAISLVDPGERSALLDRECTREKKCKGSIFRTHQRSLKRRFTSYVKSAASRTN
jgi:hypothetical protein